MITRLSIKNFALIEDITVDFKSGLTSISGETGAGKSILLGALALVLGKRADLNAVRNNSLKCIIEADFLLEDSMFKDLFKKYNLDFDSHTIIRRELLPSSKSRAFINDSPVSLSQLQAISSYLVDIHSQHETLSLFSEKYKLDLAQMSLKFLEIQPFVTSVIIGATTMDQLKINIESVNISLSEKVINEINEVQKTYPNPCP